MVGCAGERGPEIVVTRGYSREFTPRTERRYAFMVDRVPATLHAEVKAKAKREGMSVRAAILRLLSAWVKSSGDQ